MFPNHGKSISEKPTCGTPTSSKLGLYQIGKVMATNDFGFFQFRNPAKISHA